MVNEENLRNFITMLKASQEKILDTPANEVIISKSLQALIEEAAELLEWYMAAPELVKSILEPAPGGGYQIGSGTLRGWLANTQVFADMFEQAIEQGGSTE